MSRLPALGRRGEGWFAMQLGLLALVALAGILAGPDWSGLLRGLTTPAGAALILAGLLLGVRGVLDLGRSLSPFPRPLSGASMVEHGAYRFVRHPIYGGVILCAAGWSLLTASLVALGAAAALALLLDLKSRREEQWLREHHAGYEAYTRRTRRFVPRLY